MPYADLEKRREVIRRHYRQNKAKYAEKNRRWRAENPERAKELRRSRHLRSPERERLLMRLWRAERKACRREKN